MSATGEMSRVAAQLDLLPISRQLLQTAGAAVDPLIRTLDAVHLASAQLLGNSLTALVAYDRRLLAAARELGMPVASPGAAAP